jgi:octaprenyl-diphosphate synthase
MLHTASLVHDDVVDESDRRRGLPSLRAFLSNQVAVLVGDYILSKALECAAQTGDVRIVQYIAQLGQALADGELLQLEGKDSDSFSEAAYFDIISRKTASLFSVCARLGVLAAGGAEADAERMAQFGKLVGICFQLRDDVFDYGTAEVGKPVGNDIREKKITLPLIYAYAAADQEEKAKMDTMLKSEDNLSEEQVRWAVDLVRRHNGVEKTEQKMKEYQASALEKIDVAEGECRDSLVEMLRYVAERDK